MKAIIGKVPQSVAALTYIRSLQKVKNQDCNILHCNL